MNNAFLIDVDGSISINEAGVSESQMIFSAVGLGLPDEWAQKAQEKADLLECRLSRLERALELEPFSQDVSPP